MAAVMAAIILGWERLCNKKVDSMIEFSTFSAVIPVIREAKLYDKKIEIEDHPEKNYSLPEIIEKHYEDLFSAHVTSKIYNNTNIRVDEWGCVGDSGTFKFVTGRTTYYSGLINCSL